MYDSLQIIYVKSENEIRFKVVGVLSKDQIRDLTKLGWHYSVFGNNWSREYSKRARIELEFVFPELTK